MNYVQIMGGLGNQLFQYTFARYLEENTSHPIALFRGFFDMDVRNTIISSRDYSLDHFNIRHSATNEQINIDCVMTDDNLEVDLITGNTFFNGYWQDKKFLLSIHDRILGELELKQEFITEEMIRLAQEMSMQDSVAIHVRRMDYLDKSNKDIFYNISLEYYSSAVNMIRTAIGHDPVLYVFSDDYEYISTHMDNFCDCPTVLIKPHKDYEDIFLMSKARHHIIANSTFGWWGAVLSDNNGITVAPKHWFKDRKDHDLYPDNWIVMDNQIKLEKISVIIPAYNVGKYIDRCLNSIEEQTYDINNLEIIIIDDASTDDTLSHLESFESRYPDNTVLIKQDKTCGPGAARNIGMDYATGEYISFVDSDDLIDPSMLYRLYIKIKEFDCDVVDCGYRTFGDDIEIGVSRDMKEPFLLDADDDKSVKRLIMLTCSKTSVWGKLYKKRFLADNNLRFVEGIYFEDIPFSGLVMFLASSYYRINETLYFYFSNSEGIVHSKYDKERVHQEMIATERFLSALYERNMLDMIGKSFTHELITFCTTKAFVDPLALLINSSLSLNELLDEIGFFKKHLLDLFPTAASTYNLSDSSGICSLASHLLNVPVCMSEELLSYPKERAAIAICEENDFSVDILKSLKTSEHLNSSSDSIIEISFRHYDTEHLLLKHALKKEDTLLASTGSYKSASDQRCSTDRIKTIIKEYPDNRIILLIKYLFFDQSDECLKMFSEMIESLKIHNNISVAVSNDNTYSIIESLMPSADLLLV